MNKKVAVSVEDLEAWRDEWLTENDPEDGTDCVTPFDKYLYGRPPALVSYEAYQEAHNLLLLRSLELQGLNHVDGKGLGVTLQGTYQKEDVLAVVRPVVREHIKARIQTLEDQIRALGVDPNKAAE
ncbi:hypothetical protein D3C85_646030 [compost metagenome]